MIQAIIFNLGRGIAFNVILPIWAVILKMQGLM